MKNFFRILTFLLICCLILLQHNPAFAQKSATIEGVITNPKSTLASVAIPTTPINSKKGNFAGYLKGGYFNVYFEISEPTIVTFSHSDVNAYIFVKPGDKIKLNFDTGEFYNTLNFSGTQATANNFLKKYSLKYAAETGKGFVRGNDALRLKPDEYRAHEDKIKAEKIRYFNDWKRQHQVDDDFEKLIDAKIDNEWASNLIEYPFARAFIADDSRAIPDTYWAFLEDVDKNCGEAINLSEYAVFLDRYIKYHFSKTSGSKNSERYYVEKYNFAKTLLSGKPLYYVQGQTIVDACNFGKVDEIAGIYAEFASSAAPAHFKNAAKEVYEKSAKFGKGQKAPDFTLTSIDGRAVSLKSLQGKVIFLDFWASWCAPCVQEFSFTSDLKNQFSGQSIEFVYVSIDEDKDKWREFLESRGLKNHGIHLQTNGLESEFSKKYNLKGVPKYMIIDKNGNIVDGNAKRPSDPKLVNDIQAALNKL